MHGGNAITLTPKYVNAKLHNKNSTAMIPGYENDTKRGGIFRIVRQAARLSLIHVLRVEPSLRKHITLITISLDLLFGYAVHVIAQSTPRYALWHRTGYKGEP